MILLGEIHWFDPIKGYGFIRTKKGKDIFVHYSAIKGTGFRTLTDGEKVCYQIVRNPQGLVAIGKSHFTGLCKNTFKPAWLSHFYRCVTPNS